MAANTSALNVIRHHVHWFVPEPTGFGPLLDRAGAATVVLIGEASHGTHEFYAARAALTKTLIKEHGYNIVAVEADWPDAYRANRWVRHAGADGDAKRIYALLMLELWHREFVDAPTLALPVAA